MALAMTCLLEMMILRSCVEVLEGKPNEQNVPSYSYQCFLVAGKKPVGSLDQWDL